MTDPNLQQIDVTRWNGLLDIIHLGNTIELSFFWKKLAYEIAFDPEKDLLLAQLQQHFNNWMSLKRTFSELYCLKHGEETLNPTLFIHQLMVQFAVNIIKYLEEVEADEDLKLPNWLGSKPLEEKYREHFRLYPKGTLEMFDELVAKPLAQLPFCNSFEYLGPEYAVVPLQETLDEKDVEMGGKPYPICSYSMQ